MTAVFLGGGAGIAMADTASSATPTSTTPTSTSTTPTSTSTTPTSTSTTPTSTSTTPTSTSTTPTSTSTTPTSTRPTGGLDLGRNPVVGGVRGTLDDILGKVPFFPSDPLGTHQKGYWGSDHKWHPAPEGHWGSDHRWHPAHEGHWGSDHKWHPAHDCGCDEGKPAKVKDESKDTDCSSKDQPQSGDSTSDDTASEDSSPKVLSISNSSPERQVESASTSPSSSDDSQVESASTSPSGTTLSDDTTPVGAADTGDGSSSPGFTPTFTPVASSSPLDDPYVLGGGAAAAALLGAYGVSVARRRTGAHRG